MTIIHDNTLESKEISYNINISHNAPVVIGNFKYKSNNTIRIITEYPDEENLILLSESLLVISPFSSLPNCKSIKVNFGSCVNNIYENKYIAYPPNNKNKLFLPAINCIASKGRPILPNRNILINWFKQFALYYDEQKDYDKQIIEFMKRPIEFGRNELNLFKDLFDWNLFNKKINNRLKLESRISYE